MNLEGARLRASPRADAHAGEPRFVAGSIGPLNRTLSLSPDVNDPAYRAVTFDEVRDAYAEQMPRSAEGGVDLLLVETIFDTLNAKAAIAAALEERARRCRSGSRSTIADRAGRNALGADGRGVLASVEHAEPLSSASTARSARREMRPYVAELARIAHDLRELLPERRACRTPSAATTRRRATTSRLLARVRARRARQRRRRLLRHDAGAHRARSRAAVAGVAPRALPEPTPRGRASAGSSRSRSRPDTGLRPDRRAHERHRLGALPRA